jgi:8-oxo-dGTP pyrophosphatase MutT (NUDIX family)
VSNERVVATTPRDDEPSPASFEDVHSKGIPHRAVHVEVVNGSEQYLVWLRADGRLEIPGGHVNWLEEANRPETYEEAALREISEELNLPLNWQLPPELALDRLRRAVVPIAHLPNQLWSPSGANNEWVVVYRLHWNESEWLDPTRFTLGPEGNRLPSWQGIGALHARCVSDPAGTNSALRLLLGRSGILLPVRCAPQP